LDRSKRKNAVSEPARSERTVKLVPPVVDAGAARETNVSATELSCAVPDPSADTVGAGVAVAGTGVAVAGTGVAVAGTGVAVAGTGVAVAGTGVAVGGTGVAVGGTGVAVGA